MKPRSRRYSVSLRPKVRRERLRKFLAALAVAVLGAAAAATWRHLRAQLPDFKNLAAAHAAARSRPAPLPKVILARVTEMGKPAGYLSPAGALVQAPEGFYQALEAPGTGPHKGNSVAAWYPQPVPSVELGRSGPEALKPLAKFLGQLGGASDLFSPLIKLKFVSDQDGWRAFFADGTEVRWGDFGWTTPKLERLRQVLDDARGRLHGPFTVDLRYFGDGRILLTPKGASSVSMR